MVSEHNAKYAVFDLAQTPEEAYEMVQYLATVNWHQEFLARAERVKNALEAYEQGIQELTARGGGYCDYCQSSSRDRHPQASTFDCLYEYPHDPGKEWKGKYCGGCLRKIQTRERIPQTDWYLPCRNCRTLLPLRELRRDFGEWGEWCSECLKRVMIVCVICGKTTLEFTRQSRVHSTCEACYIKYPDQAIVTYHNNRAKAVGLAATLTGRQWEDAVNHFNHRCAYCPTGAYEVLEHYMPIAHGGGTTVMNCVPACERCNHRKNGKHPDDFTRLFPAENIARIRGYFESVSSLVLDL